MRKPNGMTVFRETEIAWGEAIGFGVVSGVITIGIGAFVVLAWLASLMIALP